MSTAMSGASVGSELARARELFDAGETARSARLLLTLTDVAPDVESLERVEAETRLLRQRLVDRAETTNARSAWDDLARFDQGLGDLPTAVVAEEQTASPGNALYVLLVVGLSVAGAVGGAYIGAITCHEKANPDEFDLFPCMGAAAAGFLIGLGGGLFFGLLTVWFLRKRRAGRPESEERR